MASQVAQPQQQQQQQQQHLQAPHPQQDAHPHQHPQQQQQQQPSAQDLRAQRVAYATRMRQLFSPPGMLRPDGSIDQDFFRPRTVVTLADRKWGEAERDALHRGLQQYGVGRYRDMGQDMLQGWDDTTIRLKTAKLLGCQNLSRYHGQRLSRAQVAAQYEANRQLGAATGCWKHGMLVDDDAGTLAAHFRRQQQQQQQQQHDAPAAATAAVGAPAAAAGADDG